MALPMSSWRMAAAMKRLRAASSIGGAGGHGSKTSWRIRAVAGLEDLARRLFQRQRARLFAPGDEPGGAVLP